MLTAVFGARLKKYHYLVKLHLWMCVALILVVVCLLGTHGLRGGTGAPSSHLHIFEASQSDLSKNAGLTSMTCVYSRFITPLLDASTIPVVMPTAVLPENVQFRSEVSRKHLEDNKFYLGLLHGSYPPQDGGDDGFDRLETLDSTHPSETYSINAQIYPITPHRTFMF